MDVADTKPRRTSWRRWLFLQSVRLAILVLFFALINGLYWRATPRPDFGFRHNDSCRIIQAVAFSPDSKLLAAGGTSGPQSESQGSVPSKIRVWDFDGNVVANFDELAGQVISLAFTADGNTLAWVSPDSSVKLGSVANGTCIRSIPTGRVHQIAFLPEGGLLVAADTGLMLWDVATIRVLKTYTTRKATRFAHCAVTNRLALAVFNDRDQPEPVEVYDVRNVARIAVAKLIPSRNQYVNYVRSLAFSPNGEHLAVGMDQGCG